MAAVKTSIVRGLTVGALTVAGAVVRGLLLGQPMRLDESANVLHLASQSFTACATDYMAANNHPLHTMLVRLAALALGPEPWVLRLPSFVAGVVALPLAYALFATLVDAATGLLACALAAASSPLIEYATNARGYSLQTALVVAMFLCGAKLLRGARSSWWVAFAVVSVLAFYTLPTTLFFFAAALLWMALCAVRGASLEPRPFLIRLAAAGGAVVLITTLLYTPFALTSGVASLTSNRWVLPLPLRELAASAPGAFSGYAAWASGGLGLVALVPLAAAFVVGLVVFRRVSTFTVDPVPIAIGITFGLMALQRVLPPQRVLLPLVPLGLGSCAIGLRWLASLAAERWAVLEGRSVGRVLGVVGPLALMGALSASVLATGSAYQTPDQVTFREAEPLTEILAGILQGDDVVYVQNDARNVLVYYFELHRVPTRFLYARGEHRSAIGRAFVIDSSAEYEHFTYQLALGHSDLLHQEYTLKPLAKLPEATLMQVIDPVLAPAR